MTPQTLGDHREEGRKYYALNDAGRAQLGRSAGVWRDFSSTMDKLLEDLPQHLADVAADAPGSLHSRLGPPSVYAAELRAWATWATGCGASTPPTGSP